MKKNTAYTAIVFFDAAKQIEPKKYRKVTAPGKLLAFCQREYGGVLYANLYDPAKKYGENFVRREVYGDGVAPIQPVKNVMGWLPYKD